MTDTTSLPKPVRDLGARLLTQAVLVERDGWVTAARLMREAAAEIEFWREAHAAEVGG